MTETVNSHQAFGKATYFKERIRRAISKDAISHQLVTNQTIRKAIGAQAITNQAINNQAISHQAISNHLNACYMKYVKGPNTKVKAKKPTEQKKDDGFSEQLVAKHVVNQQDQEQITNNPEENTVVPDSEPDQKPDFPKEIN